VPAAAAAGSNTSAVPAYTRRKSARRYAAVPTSGTRPRETPDSCATAAKLSAAIADRRRDSSTARGTAGAPSPRCSSLGRERAALSSKCSSHATAPGGRHSAGTHSKPSSSSAMAPDTGLGGLRGACAGCTRCARNRDFERAASAAALRADTSARLLFGACEDSADTPAPRQGGAATGQSAATTGHSCCPPATAMPSQTRVPQGDERLNNRTIEQSSVRTHQDSLTIR